MPKMAEILGRTNHGNEELAFLAIKDGKTSRRLLRLDTASI